MNTIMIFQVDLAEVKYLTKIATQCSVDISADCYSYDEYFDYLDCFINCVKTYTVEVASAADHNYTAVCGTDSCPQLFTGNDGDDPNDVVTNEFDWPIAARFVRLYPQDWRGWAGLRWEIYGCDSLV